MAGASSLPPTAGARCSWSAAWCRSCSPRCCGRCCRSRRAIWRSRRERWPELRAHAAAHGPRRAGRRDVRGGAAPPATRRPAKASIGELFAPRFAARHRRPLRVVLLLPDGQLRGHPARAVDAARRRQVHAAGGRRRPAMGRTSAASIGAVLGALVIQRFGSRLTMLGMSAVAIVCSLIMAGMRLDPTGRGGRLMLMFLVTGGLLNAVQTTMYALAAHVYPDGDSQHRRRHRGRVRAHRQRARRLRRRLRARSGRAARLLHVLGDPDGARVRFAGDRPAPRAAHVEGRRRARPSRRRRRTERVFVAVFRHVWAQTAGPSFRRGGSSDPPISRGVTSR